MGHLRLDNSILPYRYCVFHSILQEQSQYNESETKTEVKQSVHQVGACLAELGLENLTEEEVGTFVFLFGQFLMFKVTPKTFHFQVFCFGRYLLSFLFQVFQCSDGEMVKKHSSSCQYCYLDEYSSLWILINY